MALGDRDKVVLSGGIIWNLNSFVYFSLALSTVKRTNVNSHRTVGEQTMRFLQSRVVPGRKLH